SINAMIYIRGNKYDYNTWRDEYGCDGWGYNDILPYFIRAEHNSRGSIAYHGGSGPLSVIDPKFRSPASTAFVQSSINAGATANKDFNGANQDGVGFYQVTQKDGRRYSAADAYLHPVQGRPNLTVQTDALATSVIIEGGHAVGVRYSQRGAEHVARANSEVILCGGAINSPQLLMLSGIGPAEHLREHDIRVVVDSPGVGANLSDHPIVTALWATPGMKSLAELAGPKNLFRWQLTHSGPMTTNIAQSGGFVRSETGLPAPDIQWHALPVPFRNGGLADPTDRGMSVLVTLVDVHSRGRITLRSNDPRHKPLIDPGYLSDRADIDALVRGIDLVREIADAKPMRKICKAELAPGPDVRTDAELRDFIRHDVTTIYHPVGTCAMSGRSQLDANRVMGVVDTELRVRGVEGLRVVDASVMPTVPRGNTNAPTIAIAERAADLISGRAPLAALEPADLALAGAT
ncbi:MAG TPA: GMC family oxidoreductase N-terminal domain-containing protein, partial [Streptosporangiaceae bacterium]